MSEIAKYGLASVKRIYGDWTTPSLTGWKSVLLEHSIHPVQQFRYTVGKNATDSAMIIDAMDLLYTKRALTDFVLYPVTAILPVSLRVFEKKVFWCMGLERRRHQRPLCPRVTNSFLLKCFDSRKMWSLPVNLKLQMS